MYVRNILLILVTVSLLSSCQKGFLDRLPESDAAPQTFFKSERDLQIYTNQFYGFLPEEDIVTADFVSDNVNTSAVPDILTGNRPVPLAATAAGWTWTDLYKINYFLEHYNQYETLIPAEALAHYSGVARFFRAEFYFKKLIRFGDVPFYNKPLNESGPELFKGRDPRTLIVDSILADLDYAARTMRGPLAATKTTLVNKWTAYALKARICLFEASFRKYHPEFNLQASADDLYVKAAVAAKEVMNSGVYKLNKGNAQSVYLDMFSSKTPNADEYILSVLFSTSIAKAHALNGIFLTGTRGNPGITKSMMDSYLLSNGQPFSSVSGYDTLPFWKEVAGRDPRLSQTVRTPGYRRIGAAPSASALAPDYLNAPTGYQNIKFVSGITEDAASYTAIPLIRFAELLLIYAEAKAELGQLTQAEADASVNLIRERAGVPRMKIDAIVDDPQLSALYAGVTDKRILEVRRERRVELVMEGQRYNDLIRWKQGRLLMMKFKGAYFPGKGFFDLDQDGKNDILIADNRPTPLPAGVQVYPLNPGKALSESIKGNIIVNNNINKVFREDRDYLYPLPIDELTLNKNLTQNPNW